MLGNLEHVLQSLVAQELKARIYPLTKLTVLDPSVGPAGPADRLADLKAVWGLGGCSFLHLALPLFLR